MEQVAGVQWRMQEVRGHVVNHLYVYDGDLAAQDAQAAAIQTLKGEIGERLDDPRRRSSSDLEPASQERYAAVVEARKAYVAAYDQALALSREETRRERRGPGRLAHRVPRAGAAGARHAQHRHERVHATAIGEELDVPRPTPRAARRRPARC